MSYKIAIGSSDGIHVDLKFGEVRKFLIYEVGDDVSLTEERIVDEDPSENAPSVNATESVNAVEACGGSGCNSGCGGHGNGCGGAEAVISKVSLIEDCRCVVCKKIGFQAQKQFEKKAISVFDVECLISEALQKITYYYNKIDHHESFRKS